VEHEYWAYIVASRSGTLYIGMTNNIYRRMREHKSAEFDGFASQYHCNRLVHLEGFDDVRKAIDREKQLKDWRREKKSKLIEAHNPRWQDLAGIRRPVNQGPLGIQPTNPLCHPSMKTGTPVHMDFAARRTGFYSCSRHTSYVRTPPFHLNATNWRIPLTSPQTLLPQRPHHRAAGRRPRSITCAPGPHAPRAYVSCTAAVHISAALPATNGWLPALPPP
jgi:putative endonuclease